MQANAYKTIRASKSELAGENSNSTKPNGHGKTKSGQPAKAKKPRRSEAPSGHSTDGAAAVEGRSSAERSGSDISAATTVVDTTVAIPAGSPPSDASEVGGSAGLSSEEAAKLAECEDDIRSGALKMAEALLTIRDKKLYREGFETFEDYCRVRLGFSRSRAYELCDFAGISRELGEMSAMADTPLPQNERQARPLKKLKSAEQRAKAWTKAVGRAGEEPVTCKHVKAAVEECCGKPPKNSKPSNKKDAAKKPIKADDSADGICDQIEDLFQRLRDMVPTRAQQLLEALSDRLGVRQPVSKGGASTKDLEHP